MNKSPLTKLREAFYAELLSANEDYKKLETLATCIVAVIDNVPDTREYLEEILTKADSRSADLKIQEYKK